VLSWQPPTEDGGTPITGYLVERCTVPSARWMRVTREPVTEATFKVTQLMEDTQYEFRVIALNKVGESPPGPKSKPVLAKDPWGRLKKYHYFQNGVICSVIVFTINNYYVQ